MELKVKIHGTELPVTITYKRMKYARLKVFYTGEIKLSVPYDTPDGWITEFIESKRDWIEEQLSRLPDAGITEKHIVSGSTIRVLGNDLTVMIHESKHKQIMFDDMYFHIFTPENDPEKIDKQVDNWWQKTARKCYQEILDRLHVVVKSYGVAKPTLTVKKMKTLWGSCSRRTWNVNINYYLFKTSIQCIESVILHELTHFLYPNHDKAFYDFMTFYMPDWKVREKELDHRLLN